MLSQLEIKQAEWNGVGDRFLDMHMYVTSALKNTDMKAVGLQMALDLLYAKVWIIVYYFYFEKQNLNEMLLFLR